MHPFLKKYTVLLNDVAGVEAITRELEKLKTDIFDTKTSQIERIREIANAIRKEKKVLLLGMGASHFVNEIFAFQLRKLGYSAIAITASEYIYDPLPPDPSIVILTSQSGESVETVKCIPFFNDRIIYSVTLGAESTIARETNALICSGGTEIAYAGTRSVSLSLAAFAYISAELGAVSYEAIENAVLFEPSNQELFDHSVWLLFNKKNIVATGRSLFSSVAGLFALGCEELAHRPVLYNESGTFRHGPMEILNAETVLVVFRQAGKLGQLCKSFLDIREKSGCSLIVFDASGEEPLTGVLTFHCPIGDDISAALGMMSTFQLLMIAYACGKNPRTGLPRFGSKVTITE